MSQFHGYTQPATGRDGGEGGTAIASLPGLAGAGPVGHGTIKLGGRTVVAQPDAPATEPEAVTGEPAASAPTPAATGVGHGTIRFREPSAAPPPAPEPEPEPESDLEPAAAAEPEASGQEEPAAQASASTAAADLYAAYLAAASQMMAARAEAGTPDGDAKLADAVAARDAAQAAWREAAG